MPVQVLSIDPANELVFKGPFDRIVTSSLKLRNPSADAVAFKVKTTAPKRYCVRPSCGVVQPGAEVAVSVMLQPIEADADKVRHKFLVQSVVVRGAAPDNLDELWKSATPAELMDSKLRVSLQSEPSADAADAAAASLEAEIARLKEENARLVEQELRLRKLAMSDARHSDASGRQLLNQQQQQQQQRQLPAPALVQLPARLLLILSAIVGLLFGKFFL